MVPVKLRGPPGERLGTGIPAEVALAQIGAVVGQARLLGDHHDAAGEAVLPQGFRGGIARGPGPQDHQGSVIGRIAPHHGGRAPAFRLLRDFDDNVIPLHPHRVARLGIQGRRLLEVAVHHIEDGLMPGTPHPVAAQGAFRQGAPIVGAFTPDGIKFSLEADQHYLGLPHEHLAHFSVLKILDLGNFGFHGQHRLLPVMGFYG